MRTRVIAAVILVLAGLAGLVTPASPARAATLDVCPSGCTYSSIQAAIDAASDGDTIAIGAGTYVENLAIISRNVTLSGAGAASTIIDGNNSDLVIFVSADTVDVSGVTIQHGYDDGLINGIGSGAGIYHYSGTLTVSHSIIRDNTAWIGGGIYNESGATLTVTNSTISGNSAVDGGSGGGIYNDGSMTLTNSTTSGNRTVGGGSGGGIYNFGSMTLTNSTISGNSGNNGSGIYNSSASVLVTNSIVANNTGATNCVGFRNVATSHNLSWPDNSCYGLNLDPMLGPLQDNGGPTTTMMPLPGSPAIDAAQTCPSPATDQRGVSRPQGRNCDIGAVEVVDTTAPIITPVVTGTLGNNGWYTSDVTVTWTVSEPESTIASISSCETTTITADARFTILVCSAISTGGVNAETVTINRDATVPVLAPAVTPNPVSANQPATANANATDTTSGIASQNCETPDTTTAGTRTVTCTATDWAGNVASSDVSYTVTDPTAPVITPTVSGTLGDNGWYTGDVTLSWTSADTESTITSTNGCETTTIMTDTTGTMLTCTATSAGGTSRQPVTIQRDTTAPIVTFTGNRGTYTMSQTVTIACRASDATSGIAETTCQNVSAPAASFGPGEHVVAASATDQAGNTTTAETRFVVGGGSYAGLRSLTMNVVDNRLTELVLVSYLQIAERAEQRGRPSTEAAALMTYRIGVGLATRLGHITADDSQLLIDWSNTL